MKPASNAAQKVQALSAAERSEQQEWTVELQDDAIALHCGREKPILFDRLSGRIVLFRLVIEAHNAALATVEEWWDSELSKANALLAAAYTKGRWHNDIAIAQPLRDQLAAERQRREQAEGRWNSVAIMLHEQERQADALRAELYYANQQLLSALAAIPLLKSVHEWFMKQAPEHYNGCGLWIDVDAFLKEHQDL